MNMSLLARCLLGCGLMPLWPAVSLAVYTQPAATFSAGGGVASSNSYTNVAVIGQEGVVGRSSGASYIVDQGFLTVLGGLKILYPAISATPGALSFTVVAGTSGNQPLAIGNAGGSNLEWTVTKGTPDTIFSVSSASGTIIGATSTGITVTADTAGLTAGSHYTNTLTISGTGIADTVQVGLTLDVTAPATYSLTVTPISTAASIGGGTVTSDSGGISCQNTGNDPATKSGVCQANFAPGSVITLMQTPDSNSTMATWTGGCGGSTTNCQVVMTGDMLVTATFPYSSKAKVDSTGTGYDTLSLAYGGAGATDTILARDVTFSEALVLDSGKTITLSGGLDAYYAPLNAWTTIDGSLTVSQGTITADRLEIR